jgi:hypothetical protein
MGEMPDHPQVVGDEEDRQMESALQVQQEVDDLRLHGDVERRHDLIGDEHVRLDRKGASDSDALALAAAELARIALCRRRGQAHEFEQLGNARHGLRGRAEIVESDSFGERLSQGHPRVE